MLSIFEPVVSCAPPPTPGQTIDAPEVRRALALFADPTAGVAVVSLRHGKAHGYGFAGDDLDGATRMVGVIEAGASGVYLAINPVARDFKDVSGTGVPKNVDILRRRWLLVDVDSKREEKTKQGTTDEERAASKAVADAVEVYLAGEHWPDPVRSDSGNGWHLFYPCDLPNDDASNELVKRWLKHLKARFENDAAEIDTRVNPAKQLAKLPGTWARKGEAKPDRPFRPCRLLQVPEDAGELVTAELLAAPGRPPPIPPETPLKVEEEKHHPGNGVFDPVVQPRPDVRLAYCRAALEAERAKVAGKPVGSGLNEQLNKSGFVIGTLIPPLAYDTVYAVLYGACLQAGGNDPAKDNDTLTRALRDGMADPRDLSFLDEPVAPVGDIGTTPDWTVVIAGKTVRQGRESDLDALGVVKKSKRSQRFEVLSLDDLMRTEYPEPNWAVHGLLAEGLNLLAGNPKSGKSMLALNLCLTVAGGGLALEDMQVTPGDVLYLSLEDQFRRVQRRAKKMAKLLTPDARRRLSVVTQWPRVHKGGLALLREWVQRVELPRLLVIDVLAKFRPPTNGRASAYEQDIEHLYAIKEFADELGVTLLVLHHTRKKLSGKDGEDIDVFETVSGTQGITGACDGLIVMHRMRGTNDATIALTSRDDEEQKLSLQFDPETLIWKSLGSAEAHLRGEFQKKVLEYMRLRPDAILHSPGIATALEANPDAVRKTLHRLEDKGLIRRVGNGWSFPVGGDKQPEFPGEAFDG